MVKTSSVNGTPIMEKKHSRSSPIVLRSLTKRKSVASVKSPVKESNVKESANFKSYTERSETEKTRNSSFKSPNKIEHDTPYIQSTNKRKRSKISAKFDLKSTEKASNTLEVVELESSYEVSPKVSKADNIKTENRSEIVEAKTQEPNQSTPKKNAGNRNSSVPEKEYNNVIEEQSESTTASITIRKKRHKKKKTSKVAKTTNSSEKISLETKDMIHIEEDEFPGREDSRVMVYDEIMDSVFLEDCVAVDRLSNKLDNSNPPEAPNAKTNDGEKLWVRNVKEMVLTYEGNERVKALLKKCVTSHPPCRKRKKFVHWASSLYDDAAVIEETWNIISAFRFGHLVIPETELLKKDAGSAEGNGKVNFNAAPTVQEQPGLMIKNVGHHDNTVDIMDAISATGSLQSGKFYLNFYPKEDLAILLPGGNASRLDSNKLGSGFMINEKICQVVNLGPAEQGTLEVCLKPVMLLVINAPQDAKAEEVKRFLPKCQKVTKLGLSSFEATYSTVEEATEAIDFAKKTKFEGKRLLCYFCKKASKPNRVYPAPESTGKTGKWKKLRRQESEAGTMK